MRTYDVRCPFCKTLNTRLNLEETESLMECISCGNVTQNTAFRKAMRIPVQGRKRTIGNRVSRMMVGRK